MKLRPATAEDATLLLDWANDPDVRWMARNRCPIAADVHAEWLARGLSDPARRLFIAILDQQPVGQVRLDRHGELAEVDISVDKSWRGRGVGLFLLTAAELEVWSGLGALWAEVRRENEASAALFRKAGFTADGECEAYLRFIKDVRHVAQN